MKMEDAIVNMIQRQKWPELNDQEIGWQVELRIELLENGMVEPPYKKVVQQEIDELQNRAWLGKKVTEDVD